MNTVLLDTNAFRKLFDGDEAVVAKVELSDDIYVSPVVLGELYHGYMGGSREASNRRWLEEAILRLSMNIMVIEERTAQHYARIKDGLGKKGKPIPTNDLWIAAQTIELGATLITFDRHFKEITGLRLWEYIFDK